MTSKLADTLNQSMLGAGFSTPLGAAVHADGTADRATGPDPDVRLLVPDPDVDPEVFRVDSVNHLTYESIEALDTGRFIHFGGPTPLISYVEAYHLGPDSWTQLAPRPGGLGLIEHSGFVIGRKAYLFGGIVEWQEAAALGEDSSGWEYDPAADNWAKKADEPVLPPAVPHVEGDAVGPPARLGAGAEAVTESGPGRTGRNGFLFGGRYEFGGDPGSVSYFDATHRYDAELDMWVVVATSGVSRSHMGTSTLDGNIHTFGGRRGVGASGQRFINESWRFNPASGAWDQRADLIALPGELGQHATSRRSAIAATSLHGWAHLLGSDGEPSLVPQGRHDRYSWKTDSFQAITPTVVNPDEPDDPDTPAGFDPGWKRIYPNRVFSHAAACTVRGGVHLTGGRQPRSSPWDDTLTVVSTHARWTEGAWVWTELQTPIDIRQTFFQRPMGNGWLKFRPDFHVPPPVRLELTSFDEHGRLIQDDRHVTLTL